jgi:hypothetical protein
MMTQTTDLRWGSTWFHLAAIALVAGASTLIGCSDDDKDVIVDPGPTRDRCTECHTDQVRLEALAIPDDPPGETGEG